MYLENRNLYIINGQQVFYVCSDILKIREEMAREVILGFLQDMSKIGYSKLEIQQLLKGGA